MRSSDFHVVVSRDDNRVSVRVYDMAGDIDGKPGRALTYDVTVAVELERDSLKLAISDMARHLVRYIYPPE